jgi:hypothetical protein
MMGGIGDKCPRDGSLNIWMFAFMVGLASGSDFVEDGTSMGAVCQCDFSDIAHGRPINVEVVEWWCLEGLGVKAYRNLARTHYDIARWASQSLTFGYEVACRCVNWF